MPYVECKLFTPQREALGFISWVESWGGVSAYPTHFDVESSFAWCEGIAPPIFSCFLFFFFKRRNWCLMITWIINDMLSKLYFFVGDAFLTSKIMYSYNDKLLSLGCVLATKFYSTLCDHMHYSCQVSLHGILQARRLEWVPIPFSRGSFQPTNWTPVSWIASIFVTIGATWEPDLGYSSTNFPYQIVVLHVI